MSRRLWVLGNWKQNLLRGPSASLAKTVADGLGAALGGAGASGQVAVGIAPTYLALDSVAPYTGDGLVAPRLLAQDIGAQESGAFTGEVGPAMLREARVEAAIIGHSERRAHFGDTDELVARKLVAALTGGLDVVLCVGERLEQRDAGEHESVVISQLSAALSGLSPELVATIIERDGQGASRVTLAYEPVWAIGTGRTASPAQASEMHAAIRRWLDDAGLQGADRSILYGGSVKPDNATELLAAGEIDGFLVGGASLDARSFLDIVTSASNHARSSPSR